MSKCNKHKLCSIIEGEHFSIPQLGRCAKHLQDEIERDIFVRMLNGTQVFSDYGKECSNIQDNEAELRPGY